MEEFKNWLNKFITECNERWEKDPLTDKPAGTKWLEKGHLLEEIKIIEQSLDIELSENIKILMQRTKGFSIEDFPWKLNINYLLNNQKQWYPYFMGKDVWKDIKEGQNEGYIEKFEKEDIVLLPIFSHRCIICSNQPELNKKSIVLSAMDEDVIVYGKNLKEYLINEFLPES